MCLMQIAKYCCSVAYQCSLTENGHMLRWRWSGPWAAGGSELTPSPFETSALPGTHTPGIHVHKITARVVAHPTCTELQRCIAKLRQRNPGKSDINSLAVHVQAAACHTTAATRPKTFIGLR